VRGKGLRVRGFRARGQLLSMLGPSKVPFAVLKTLMLSCLVLVLSLGLALALVLILVSFLFLVFALVFHGLGRYQVYTAAISDKRYKKLTIATTYKTTTLILTVIVPSNIWSLQCLLIVKNIGWLKVGGGKGKGKD
jgi:hypothetical protein